jgi:hypothetical protein
MTVCPFKKYSEIFGRVGEGVHNIRILDTPVVDFVLTLLLAMLITWLTKIPLVITTIVCFLLSIIIHILFGVNTTVVKWLGIKC